jgi:LPPG:FO 2-phospho-L-lactate transferase
VLREFARALGLRAELLPMCDEPVATVVDTPAGELAFQEYFVRRRQRDEVRGVRFAGIEHARVSAEVRAALTQTEAVIFCPSNPIVSIGPILAVPGIRAALVDAAAPVVGVSPIIAGAPVRGMADKVLAAIGVEASAAAVALHYGAELLDGWLVDDSDAAAVRAVTGAGIAARARPLLMSDPAATAAIASAALELAEEVRR